MSDLAWAAGLFEGEGCFFIDEHRNGHRYPRLQLGMADADVVERFASLVGYGKIRLRERQREGWSTIYEWSVKDARGVMAVTLMLLPWLGVRRRAKAEEVLEIAVTIGLPKGESETCPNGHPYSGDNLRFEVSKGYRTRRCRTCRRASSRQRYARMATAAPGEKRGD
jgi:hypothetical protein